MQIYSRITKLFTAVSMAMSVIVALSFVLSCGHESESEYNLTSDVVRWEEYYRDVYQRNRLKECYDSKGELIEHKYQEWRQYEDSVYTVSNYWLGKLKNCREFTDSLLGYTVALNLYMRDETEVMVYSMLLENKFRAEKKMYGESKSLNYILENQRNISDDEWENFRISLMSNIANAWIENCLIDWESGLSEKDCRSFVAIYPEFNSRDIDTDSTDCILLPLKKYMMKCETYEK